jgi:hypothetical protein
MADTPEAVAALLRDFIEKLEEQTAAALQRRQTQVRPAPGRRPPENPMVTVCRQCVTKLNLDDRAKLRELIETMSAALADPRGAPAPRR